MSENRGWICPVCGAGLAPWKEKCDCVERSTEKIVEDYPWPVTPSPHPPPWHPYTPSPSVPDPMYDLPWVNPV